MPEKRSSKASSPSASPTRARQKTATAKNPSTQKSKGDEQVILPHNMPLRAKEKAAVIRAEFSDLWDPAMIKIAMVSGLCFVVFGASLSLLDTFKGVPLTAQLIDSAQNSSLPAIDTTQYEYPVTITLDQSSPVSGIVDIKVAVENAERVRVGVVRSDGSFAATDLGTAAKNTASLWAFPWDTTDFPDGTYRVRVEVQNQFTQYFSRSPEFTVENTSSVSQNNTTDTIPSTSDSSPTSSESIEETTATYEEIEFRWTDDIPPAITEQQYIRFEAKNVNADYLTRGAILQRVGETMIRTLDVNALLSDRYRLNIDPRSYSSGQYYIKIQLHHESKETLSDTELAQRPIAPDQVITAGPVFIGTPTQYQAFLDAGNAEEEVVQEVIDLSTEQPKETTPTNSGGFALTHPDSVLTGTEIIQVQSNLALDQLELYAKNRTTGNELYVARGGSILGSLGFRVYTRNLGSTGKPMPNGEYDVYATARTSDGKYITSDKLRIRVFNEVEDTVTSVPITPSDSGHVNDAVSPSTVWEADLRAEENFLQQTTSDTLRTQTTNLLSREEATLRTLLREYAVAEASGDATAIAEAQAKLDEKREALVFAAKQDESLKDVVGTIEQTLEEEIGRLTVRVQKFEAIKREREVAADEMLKDTDNDGISDADERNLYGTDPERTDSDGDGANDADELVMGSNPADASENQAIYFESPKESIALVREDVLAVSQIRTVPTETPEEATPDADGKVEIWGTALPNSFVTLYIFSNPIVVTIKTDADGSFVYTLDRELEDGSHDVYVAVTDNTGSIVAQSNPFSFIKQAQAFTPVDAAEAAVVSDERAIEPTDSLSSTGTVVGLGVLALGLILLMLGVSLRLRQPAAALVSEGVHSDGDSIEEPSTPKPVAVSERKFEHIDASES